MDALPSIYTDFRPLKPVALIPNSQGKFMQIILMRSRFSASGNRAIAAARL